MIPVTLDIRFPELFGENKSEIPPEVRRQRWEEWKHLALENGSKESIEQWTNAEECQGCRHLDRDWCKRQDLPATVNPYLTFRHGTVGMACYGAGYEAMQPELSDDTGELF